MKQQVTVETTLHTTLEIEGNSLREIEAKALTSVRGMIKSGNTEFIVENNPTKMEVTHVTDI